MFISQKENARQNCFLIPNRTLNPYTNPLNPYTNPYYVAYIYFSKEYIYTLPKGGFI